MFYYLWGAKSEICFNTTSHNFFLKANTEVEKIENIYVIKFLFYYFTYLTMLTKIVFFTNYAQCKIKIKCNYYIFSKCQ